MSGFDPWDTRANPVLIREGAEGLRRISGLLLGHEDDVDTVLSQVALSFSEVIAADVAAQIGNNLFGLQTAVEATHYGYAVGSAWADDVESFKVAREELLYRWELAAIDDFGVAAPLDLWPRPEPEEAERLYLEHRVAVAEARTAALHSFILEGQALWEAFQVQVELRGRMFREGPTAQNIRLVVSYLGWGAMTLWPDIAPPPVTAAEGAADGVTVLAGLDGAAGPHAVADALADVVAINRRAESGQPLTQDEIDFLAGFYETLGRRVTEIPDYLAQASFTYTSTAGTPPTDPDSPPIYTGHTVGPLDPAMVGALTAASANGLLVLSRNGFGGGGYARLPTWVRDSLDDDQFLPSGVAMPPTVDGFAALVSLGEFLGHSDIEAGNGLSRELVMATSRMLEDLEGLEGELQPGLPSWIEQVDVTGQSLLAVVARNDGVCFDMVTGAHMPDSYDATRLFTEMYIFPWSDQGASAAAITDFIPVWAASDDPVAQAAAHRAAFDLVQIVTGDAAFQQLMDGAGRSGLAQESAVGQVNPAVTHGLAEVMGAVMDGFAMPQSDVESPAEIGELPFEIRIRFATLIGTDPDSAAAIAAAAHIYEQQQLLEYAVSGDTEPTGAGIGRIWGIVDAGLINAEIDADGDRDMALADAARSRQFGVDLAKGLLGSIPVPGVSAVVDTVAAVFDAFAAENAEGAGTMALPSPPESAAQRRYNVASSALLALVTAGDIPESAIPVPFVGPSEIPLTTEDLTQDVLNIADTYGYDLERLLTTIGLAYLDPALVDERGR